MLCGGFSPSFDDAHVYHQVGIPPHRIFVVEASGRVLPYISAYMSANTSSAGAGVEEQQTWESYIEMYPHLQHLFPKVPRASREVAEKGSI